MEKRFLSLIIFSFLFLSSSVLTEQVPVPDKVPVLDRVWVIKFGTIAPEGSTWVKIFHQAIEEIDQRSKGRLKVIFYGGSVMGDEPDMIRKLRLEQLQAGGFTITGICKMAPEMTVVILPCIFQGIDEVDYLRDKLFDTMAKFFDKHDYILLAWIDMGGFAQIFSKNPVRNPDDLAKQRMFVWAGQRLDEEYFAALGIKPIPLPLPEVLPALQTGLINAVYNSPLGAVALQWHTQINYLTKLDLAYGPAVVVASKKFWNTVPDDLKGLIREIFNKYVPILNKNARRDDDVAYLGMYKRGIEIIQLTPQEKEEFVRRLKPVWDKLADDMYPRWLMDRVLALLAEYRESQGRP